MTTDVMATALAAVLDSLTLVQGQLNALAESNARIEQNHNEIMARLDTIDAGQAGLTDLLPAMEIMLDRQIEDRKINRAAQSQTAVVAAFAHAAAMGQRAPLPVDVADDPLLERFLLTQPADYDSPVRALVDWRKAVENAGTEALLSLLASQYQPSPTDTVDTRILRYQLAAITRAELAGRGATLPNAPISTIADDRPDRDCAARSETLARLWRGGATAALFAEPELAGAVDLFVDAERRAGALSEDQLSSQLAMLHRELGDRIEAGERPALYGVAYSSARNAAQLEPEPEMQNGASHSIG
jgi:hypothetical protein